MMGQTMLLHTTTCRGAEGRRRYWLTWLTMGFNLRGCVYL